SIVLLFGWLDASPSHLQKYVEAHRENFPTSTIVLVKASTSFYWTSQSKRESLLMPIVDVIKSAMSGGPRGGFQFMTLRKLLSKLEASRTGASSSIKAPTAMILDSVPGDKGLRSAIASSTPSNPLFRVLSIPPVVILYALFYVMNACGGNPAFYPDLRASLNSPVLLPSVTITADSKDIPRLYVYSHKDKMSLASDIARHVADAESKGFDVSVEIYGKTAHVSHARSDPDRYWGAIRDIWSKALATYSSAAL
ncbi:uncharacterized protein STEHIDRAFT_61492, partial [Stereum hirsutum FP-91666 SS1]|uniref:uncharacterized protein n=1 Tax=Stereum hirsutum (strain FP-91666) TaxID=721885 RepID=UPI000444A289